MSKTIVHVVDKPENPLIENTRLLTTEELCKWWKVSRKYIWELSTKRKGEERLPSYKMGRRRLYMYDECCWYLKKQEAA